MQYSACMNVRLYDCTRTISAATTVAAATTISAATEKTNKGTAISAVATMATVAANTVVHSSVNICQYNMPEANTAIATHAAVATPYVV
jgi:hypothetical protein